MKASVKFNGKSCFLIHKWEEKKRTSITSYYECKKCKSRKVTQSSVSGYQPVDWDWITGITDKL